MGGDLVALHNPFDSAFAVDDVVVCFFGYAGYGDVAVVVNGLILTFFRETHY